MLIRRHNDGTLPVVLGILNHVLEKHDAEEFAKGKLALQFRTNSRAPGRPGIAHSLN